tara:strand:+ start:259 stop:636 length:378 start_codon:yes stop_codon:yes gene_type:complete
MTENDLLLKIEGLEKVIQEKNADANRYQDELKQTKQQLVDYNKPELTPAQLDDVHNAIENAVNDFDFEDEGIYDKEFELDYDGRVALSHISINCTYELVETIVKRVHSLFQEAECPTDKNETNDK